MPSAPENNYDRYGVDKDHPRVVIACRVMKTEIDALLAPDAPIEVRYLDQNLHRTPERMAGMIRADIAAVEDYAAHIVLGYGLCSNGIVGIRATRQEICVPRVHDCIALMLGSRQDYHEAFNERAGTYYLTAGWVAEEKDPLGTFENEYVPKMGREDAEWGLREELKHYTHIVLIGSKGGDMAMLRKRARENAEFLRMKYEEVDGSDRYFRKMLFGPYDPGDFVCIPPGEKIPQKPFLQA